MKLLTTVLVVRNVHTLKTSRWQSSQSDNVCVCGCSFLLKHMTRILKKSVRANVAKSQCLLPTQGQWLLLKPATLNTASVRITSISNAGLLNIEYQFPVFLYSSSVILPSRHITYWTNSSSVTVDQDWQRKTYKNGWQPPDLKFLGSQSMFLALAAVVELILTEFFFLRESFQTSVETDRLSL